MEDIILIILCGVIMIYSIFITLEHEQVKAELKELKTKPKKEPTPRYNTYNSQKCRNHHCNRNATTLDGYCNTCEDIRIGLS